MSLSFLLHSVKLVWVCVCGQIKLVLWLPMYCANSNLNVCVIWASKVRGVFQKWSESLQLTISLEFLVFNFFNFDVRV